MTREGGKSCKRLERKQALEISLDDSNTAATFTSDPSEVGFNTKTVGVRSGLARVRGRGEGGSSGRYYRAAAETELLHG